MTKGWKIYWGAMVVIALCLACWSLAAPPTAPFSDGHGPDPGSVEYLRVVASNREHTPIYAILTSIYWLILAGLGAGLFLAARSVLRLIRIC